MGIFDFIRRNRAVSAADLIAAPYEQKYLAQCRTIWQNWVPRSGQSDVLQGELLRACEKLRHEAQDNGNINWDDQDFPFLCDFLRDTLCSQSIFTKAEKQRITLAANHLRACGSYAFRFNNGEIPEDAVNPDILVYMNDNLYDILADAVGYLYLKHPEPIPHAHNPNLHI